MSHDELKNTLSRMADPTMEAYQRKVVSDSNYPMYCVRMPVLRKLAKQCAKGELDTLLADAAWESYEEVLVLGLAVAYEDVPLEDKLTKLWKLLPRLDSWAMTDSIVPTIRFQAGEAQSLWDFALRCLESNEEYIRRFGIVIFLNHFLTTQWIPMVEEQVAAIQDDRYYVQMARAWLLAEMAVTQPERVMRILKQGELDLFVHNMTIRKMRESYRISREQKQAAALLRRKE